MNFSFDALEAAQTALGRLREAYFGLASGGTPNADYVQRFHHEINQDLNIPKALVVMWEVLKSAISDADKKATIDQFDRVLGLNLAAWKPEVLVIPEEVLALAERRRESRANKNWAESDSLRKEIQALGYEVEDSAGGMQIRKA